MLISKKVITKWNAKTKVYYESLGYQYTKMRDEFEVNVEDLSNSSCVRIMIECDYCHTELSVIFHHWLKSYNDSIIKKDTCHDCAYLKARESIAITYGVSNMIDIPGSKEKRSATILEKYGVENVFQLEEVKEKIKKTMIEKYGNSSFTRTELYAEKSNATSLERYGKTSWMKTKDAKDMFSGENSPVWKGGIHDPRWDRLQPIYKEWRNKVFGRDRYICQKCLEKPFRVEAHHILNWNDNPDQRYEIDNGITLCLKCHSSFHSKYGKRNNDSEQLTEFLNET
jgi:hypothetical protein